MLIILRTSILQFPTYRERPFPHAGTTVPPSGDASFPKRERRFPQVDTTVPSSGNGSNPKWELIRNHLKTVPDIFPLRVLLHRGSVVTFHPEHKTVGILYQNCIALLQVLSLWDVWER